MMRPMGWVSLLVLQTSLALGQIQVSLGAYAVSQHRICGVSDLPNTVREIEKLRRHEGFADFFELNFYRNNRDVHQTYWAAEGDWIASDEAVFGAQGSDASLVTYIASHGVTKSDVYTASMGTYNYGGCDARSSRMTLGDHDARYLILSTCQGLKIGNGNNPYWGSADPRRTWNGRAVGLNCIFGYSNNMLDSSNYGTYFLDLAQTEDQSLAATFLRAGRRVSRGNIPVTLCFGDSEEDAIERLQTEREFSLERNEALTSAYLFERMEVAMDDLRQLHYPATIEARAEPADLGFVARNLLGAKTIEIDPQKHQSPEGHLTFHPDSQSFYFRGIASRHRTEHTSDEESVAIARRFLERSGLYSSPASPLVHRGNIERVLSSSDEGQEVIGKWIRFTQTAANFPILDHEAEAEVFVAHGEVVEATMSPRRLHISGKSRWKRLSKEALMNKSERMQRELQEQHPQANLHLVDRQLGYEIDTASGRTGKMQLRLTFEVTGETFGRRYRRSTQL